MHKYILAFVAICLSAFQAECACSEPVFSYCTLNPNQCGKFGICIDQNGPEYYICYCESTHFWNGVTCELSKSYGTSCSGVSGECDSNRGLFCPASGAGPQTRANCPTASLTTSQFCDCAAGQFFDNRIRGIDACANLLSFGADCSNNCQCSSSLNLVCTSNKCSCGKGMEWSGAKCCLTGSSVATFFQVNEQTARFSAVLPDIKTLIVHYSSQRITGFEFIYKFGFSKSYADTSTSSYSIDFSDSKIVGIGVRYLDRIIGLEFLVENQSTKASTWTPLLGSSVGYFQRVGKTFDDAVNFEIYEIVGNYDSTSITSLHINSKYLTC